MSTMKSRVSASSGEDEHLNITLGNNLDDLLNNLKKDNKKFGIKLPSKLDSGTGNIVIKGSPGTGKSTLALQLLYKIAYHQRKEGKLNEAPGNYSIYLSLEEQIDHIINKMNTFNWDGKLNKLQYFPSNRDIDSPEALAKSINRVFSDSTDGFKNNDCNRILMPMISPRSVDGIDNNTYWERYKQIEKFLIASDYISASQEHPDSSPTPFINTPNLRAICIDSLNVFGDRPLSRDEIFRLFDLFKRHSVLGIFICESNDNNALSHKDDMIGDIDFSSEVVISLQHGMDQGYLMHYLEVEKSRYLPQVFGKHPYFIKHVNDNETNHSKGDATESNPSFPFWVYPSLHYRLSEYASTKDDQKISTKLQRWKEQYSNVFPHNLFDDSVISLSGPRNTFKSTIARDFLSNGILDKNARCNGLIIRFVDKEYNPPDKWTLFSSKSKFNEYSLKETAKMKATAMKDESVCDDNRNNLFKLSEDLTDIYTDGLNNNVLNIKKWSYSHNKNNFIMTITIKKKSITSEELIHYLTKIIENEQFNIQRIVLDEANLISISYPFLKSSTTSGSLFLNTFVALTKKLNKTLLITVTTGEISHEDNIVNRSISLSDISITTRICDIFGKQKVIISGSKIVNSEPSSDNGQNSGVLRLSLDEKYFTIDNDYLKGLIGFENGKVFRPGLSINLFEEGRLQRKYNKQISHIYNVSYPEHSNITGCNNSEKSILVTTFSDRNVETMHETLINRGCKPLEGTVVSMVDDFWDNNGNQNTENEELYYTNCLLLAYNEETLKLPNEFFNKDLYKWEDLYNTLISLKVDTTNILDADFFINETLSCLLLDTITSSYKQSIHNKKDVQSPVLWRAFNQILRPNGSDKFLSKLTDELFYLTLMFKSITPEEQLKKYTKTGNKERFNKNSKMIVCWYTQLMEFIRSDSALNHKIKIAPLPGRGFVGDWKLKVMEGSLNIEHGMDTINLLCRPEEEIKRFALGIGLPTWLNEAQANKLQAKNKISSNQLLFNYPAWIGSNSVTLADVSKIYREANKRSIIDNYEYYRHVLSIAMRNLISLSTESKDNYKESATKILIEINAKPIIQI